MATTALVDEGEPALTDSASTRRLVDASWLPIAAVVLLAVAIYVPLALHSPLPAMWPDEFRYAHLARSLADGDGFVWRTQHIGQPAALYVYILAPIWALFHSTITAYAVSKCVGAVALSLQAVPVYLLATRLMSRRLALVPAVLSVAGTWMLISAKILTEAIALPLSTTALCFTVAAIQRPSRRTGFLALAFAFLATWARLQVAVLIIAIGISFLLDVFIRPRRERRERLAAHLPYLAPALILPIVGVIAALVQPSVTGTYSDLFGHGLPVGKVFSKTALELGGLVAAGGFLPVLLAAALGARRSAWRHPAVGPLLMVFWPAALLTAGQSGMFLVADSHLQPIWWGIERYVFYVLPIAFILAVVGVRDRRLANLPVLAMAGAFGTLLAFHPARALVSEERAAWSTSYRVHQLVGAGTGVALALTALLAVSVLLAARTAPGRRRASAGLVALVAVTASLLAVQDQASWSYLASVSRTFRHSMPTDLRWVDHNNHGQPVALLGLASNAPGFEVIDFFNRSINAAYGPARGLPGRPIAGRVCSWGIGPGGSLVFQPACGPVPHTFLVNDAIARITFKNELWSAQDPHVGRMAQVRDRAPRIRSIVVMPCPRLTPQFSLTSPKIVPASAPFGCPSQFAAELWSDQSGTMTIRYAGGKVPRIVTIATQQTGRQPVQRTWQIPAGGSTNVRLPVPAAPWQMTAEQSWNVNVGNPRILGIDLTAAGRTTTIAQ